MPVTEKLDRRFSTPFRRHQIPIEPCGRSPVVFPVGEEVGAALELVVAGINPSSVRKRRGGLSRVQARLVEPVAVASTSSAVE